MAVAAGILFLSGLQVMEGKPDPGAQELQACGHNCGGAVMGTQRMLSCAVLAAAALLAPAGHAAVAADVVAMSGLHAVGNQIVNGAGQDLFLHGVNRSGTEYACIQGWGIFDGPSDQSMIDGIKSWNANAVRVPLNEDCWLGINSSSAYVGAAYRSAITSYVNLITASNLAVIIDLHWNAPGTQQATTQQPMPDADHSSAFWSSVAGTFKNNGAVVFDLYNEPYPERSITNSSMGWSCWQNGGSSCAGMRYSAVGMQSLVNTVRAAGATNLVMLGGLDYANDLSQWLAYKPGDSQNNLAASWHMYEGGDCGDVSCWTAQVAPVTAQVPLVTGEFGSNCDSGFLDSLWSFLESHDQGYLAWTWDTWGDNCSSYALVNDYSGTPTAYGAYYQAHLVNLPSTYAGQNEVQNPGFDSGVLAPWAFDAKSALLGSAAVDSSTRQAGADSARITVNFGLGSSTASHVLLDQAGLPLIAGHSYTLSFWARSGRSRNALVLVQDASASGAADLSQSFALTTAWQLYSYSFTAGTSSANGELLFELGQTFGKVWIDSVSLR